MSSQKVYNLTSTVAPGGQIDIPVDMVAPSDPGSYQASWMLRNASGALFGTGPQANQPLQVKIGVIKVDLSFVNTYCDPA